MRSGTRCSSAGAEGSSGACAAGEAFAAGEVIAAAAESISSRHACGLPFVLSSSWSIAHVRGIGLFVRSRWFRGGDRAEENGHRPRLAEEFALRQGLATAPLIPCRGQSGLHFGCEGDRGLVHRLRPPRPCSIAQSGCCCADVPANRREAARLARLPQTENRADLLCRGRRELQRSGRPAPGARVLALQPCRHRRGNPAKGLSASFNSALPMTVHRRRNTVIA